MSTITEKQFKATTELFYESIRAEFNKMMGVKKNNITVFNQDYVFQVLGEKYYRSPKTIENIVYNRVSPKKTPTPINGIQLTQQVA